MNDITPEVRLQLVRLIRESSRVYFPISDLGFIQEKLETRSYRSFDRKDILEAMGSLSGKLATIREEIQKMNDLLKQG